jgi:hypothetical protein
LREFDGAAASFDSIASYNAGSTAGAAAVGLGLEEHP